MPTRVTPSSRTHRFSVLWMLTVCVACSFVTTAHSQVSLDLGELRPVFQRLHPESVWDTAGAVDRGVLEIGTGYKVPNFLKWDFPRNQSKVEYGAIPGYRVTYTFPRTYSFEFRPIEGGEFFQFTPPDLSIPGLEIELTPFADVVEQVREKSLQSVWVETVKRTLELQKRSMAERRGGINVELPVPMPSQLETIFGPGEKTHINIAGRESITFAGESRRVSPFIGVEGQQSQSLFPSLDMQQELDVTLTGSIGDKVNIEVDHSSQAVGDNANKIRLNYTGYEDDVIQRIELGNTSLSLPGSQLISFSTASKGLFGVKMLAQIGATDITMIASKQEGETSNATFSPTGNAIGQTEARTIRDIDYIKNQYFFLDNPFRGIIRPDNGDPVNFPIEVYESVLKSDYVTNPELARDPGRAFVDSSGTGADIDAAMGIIAAGGKPPANRNLDWRRLEVEVDYDFIVDADSTNQVIGIILDRPVDESRALAVTYKNVRGDVIGGRYTDYGITIDLVGGERDTLVLELIKDTNPRPNNTFGEVWDYMMRNFYNLGLSNIDANSLELTIEDLTNRLDRTFPEGSQIPYLRIFGLDRYDLSGNPIPDNRVDLVNSVLDLRTGILQFPSLRPFAPDTTRMKQWTDFSFFPDYQEQYTTSKEIYTKYLTNPSLNNVYVIKVSATSTSRSFRIEAINIIENSEKITLDGQQLSRGSDYEINYDTGEVELKGDALNSLTPSSRITIDYEYKPFGGGAASSLVGFSTTSKIGQEGRVGTTWLYESKTSATGRPRLGEEPTRAVVGGINTNFQHTSEFLTDLANKLPLVDTDAPSQFNVSGEIAMSIPDPNTRGESYIEDFEGVEDSDRISTSRRSWYWASPPIDTNGVALPEDLKYPFIWYNIEPDNGVHKRDLNPELDERENTLVSTLDIELDPTAPDTLVAPHWAGVMTGFGGGGLDLTEGQFIEIWVNDFKPNPADRGGFLRIDMGSIDEDFWNPSENKWDDEDRSRDGFAVCLDDAGLDGEFNTLPECLANVDPDAPTEGGVNADDDVNGDDYNPRRIDGRFTKVNGTEKNSVYDTEDLDRSGSLDEFNSYFSYIIDLSDTAVVDVRKEYPTYDGFNDEDNKDDAWRLYRIDLSKGIPVSPSGDAPAIDQIRQIRIWFDDVQTSFRTSGPPDSKGLIRRFQIAEPKIVGNRWQKDGIRRLDNTKIPADSLAATTTFGVGVISTKTDPADYNPPIRPNIQNEVADKEQSLFISYEDLEPGQAVRILKQFSGNGIDLTQYRDLNFWVHADEQTLNSDLEYYFRMGTNQDTYYEVAVPMTQKYFDPVTGWARVLIKLTDLTDLKFAPADSAVTGVATDLVEEGRTYPVTLLGNPTLFSVRFLYAGVRNKSNTGQHFTGEVWLDDIYVGDVRRDIGYAARLNGNVNIGGGVLSISGGWTRRDAEFRGLRERRGSGSLNQTINLSGKSRLENFIPLFGFSIPFSMSYNRNTSLPKYRPNSDTEITEPAVRDSLQSLRIGRNFGTSLSKKGSKNRFLKYSIDKLSTSFTIGQTRSWTPASRDSQVSMNGNAGYLINWTKPRDVRLYKKYKIRYWLNSFQIRVGATRKVAQRYRLINGVFRPDPFIFDAKINSSGSVNYQPFKSLSSSLSMQMQRDVNLPHEVWGVDIGQEVGRSQNLNVNYKPPPILIIGALSPDLNVKTTYIENAGPNVRRVGDPIGTRTVSNSRVASLKMRLDLGDYFGKLFDHFGWLKEEPERKGRKMRPAPPDSASAKSDTTAAPRADPMVAVRYFGRTLKEIRRVNISVRQQTNSAYTRVPERPSLAYQLGFDNNTGIVTDDGAIDKPDRTNTNLTISAESGVQLSKDIDIAGRYSTTFTNSATLASETESRSINWPDFNVSWRGLERLGFFKRVMSSTAANFNFQKTHQESGIKGNADNIRETLRIQPTLTFVFKNEINSNLTMQYNKGTTNNRGNQAETNDISIALDLKKSIQGGQGFKLPIPFFSREIKWRSVLNTNLNITYSRRGGKRFITGTDIFEPIPSNTSLKVSPNIVYNFSSALNGRLFVDYTRNYSEATGQTTTSVRVGINATFTF